MPVYWSKADGRWRFEFDRRIEGRRYRLTKLLPKGWGRDQAEAYDRKECGRLAAQATGLTRERLPLAGAVKLYLEHRIPNLRNGKKAAQDLAQLVDLIEPAYLDEVSDIANGYRIAQAPHHAPATIRNRLAYLKAAVRYAYREHNYGDRDYTDRMMLPAPNNERQVYARMAELNRLWKALKDPEARALFKLVFYLGLRWRAELLTRTKADIQKNGADVWLQIGVTKNGRPVMKFVNHAVRDCLKFIPFQHSDRWYYDRWRDATKAIGRPDLHPHDLRHSLGSEVLNRPGASLDDVRAALHHQSLQASSRYAHLYPEKMKAILTATGQKIPQSRRRKPKEGGRKNAASA
jgi:integrase